MVGYGPESLSRVRSAVRSTCGVLAGMSLLAAEPLLRSRGHDRTAHPVFLVGAPRSGTTLAYQLITNCLPVAYFPNAADNYPRTPVAATWLLRKAIREYSSDFASSRGYTYGLAGPSQGDRIWARWFGASMSPVSPGAMIAKDISCARATVGAIAGILRGPFVNKSIANSVRIPALAQVFPGSLFVHVKRDLVFTAQSQYLNYLCQPLADGRIKRWTSAKPPEYPRLVDLPLVAKATAQVYYVQKCVERELCEVEQSIEIQYDSMCADPRACLDRVRAHPALSDCELVNRRDPPEAFPASRSIKVERNVFHEIESILGALVDDGA